MILHQEKTTKVDQVLEQYISLASSAWWSDELHSDWQQNNLSSNYLIHLLEFRIVRI